MDDGSLRGGIIVNRRRKFRIERETGAGFGNHTSATSKNFWKLNIFLVCNV
jgi:hypothetical protein